MTLSEATYDDLEDLASSTLDRALVLSRYAGGPLVVPQQPCLALVVDGVNELVQFVLGVQDVAVRLDAELRALARDPDDEPDPRDERVRDDLHALVSALREGGTSTFQYTWTDGQVVFYWPSVWVARGA